jgi:hypothetical protein
LEIVDADPIPPAMYVVGQPAVLPPGITTEVLLHTKLPPFGEIIAAEL